MEDLPEDDTVNIKGLRIRSTLAVAAANTITDTANFNPKMSSLGFSLIDHEGERILNLISPNANLLQMWLFGLRCVLAELPILYPDDISKSGRNLLTKSQKASIRFRRGSRSRPPPASKKKSSHVSRSGSGSGSGGRPSSVDTSPPPSISSTPATTPSGTPLHTPTVSRQNSREVLNEHNYDVFSENGSAWGSGDEGSVGGRTPTGSVRGGIGNYNFESGGEEEGGGGGGGGGGGVESDSGSDSFHEDREGGDDSGDSSGGEEEEGEFFDSDDGSRSGRNSLGGGSVGGDRKVARKVPAVNGDRPYPPPPPNYPPPNRTPAERTKSRELVDSERLQKQIKIMGEEKKEEGEGGEGGGGRRRGRGKRKVRGVVRMKSAMLSKMGLKRGSRKEGGE